MNKEILTKPVVINGKVCEEYSITSNGKVTHVPSGEDLSIHKSKRYLFVQLLFDDKLVLFPLAKMVLESFGIEPSSPDEKTVCYKDAYRDNVNLDNLFWTNADPWWVDDRIVLHESIMREIKQSGVTKPGRHEEKVAKSLGLPLIVVRRALFGSLENAKEIERKEQEELRAKLLFKIDTMKHNSIKEEIYPLIHIGLSDEKILEYLLYKYDQVTHDHFKDELVVLRRKEED